MKRWTWMTGLIVILATATAAMASTASWWHGLSQSSRNQKILTEAMAEVGNVTGENCKNWVRRIVKEASQNVVTIPSTASNNYEWQPSPDVYSPAMCLPIENAAVGSVIQMVYTSQPSNNTQPHTMILKSKTPTKFTVVDCNWVGVNKVGVHDFTYSQFYNGVQGYRYTVYTIK